MLAQLGSFTEARDQNIYVLERQRAVPGADHLNALITANGLGADLRALGDFQQALALDGETYASLAASLRQAGRTRDAEELRGALSLTSVASWVPAIPKSCSCTVGSGSTANWGLSRYKPPSRQLSFNGAPA